MYEIVKRGSDILLSSLALLVLSPLMIPIMIILKLTGEHYIFYSQNRIGRGGKPFKLLKFATMLLDSPNLGTGDITLKHDPRILPFGHFLRKTKINELPQLLNVLKGDMSIIGPRPVTQKHFAYYSDDVQAKIGRVAPGLSGVGSAVFRGEEHFIGNCGMDPEEFYQKHISPYKGELEVWYAENRSLHLDIRLVLLTGWMVIFPHSRLYHRLDRCLPRPSSARLASLMGMSPAEKNEPDGSKDERPVDAQDSEDEKDVVSSVSKG